MTGGIGSGLHLSSRLTTRAVRVAAVLLGVGLLLATGPVRAQDADEDDGKTFEEKLMDNLMSGLGGKKLEDGSIDYRERSPLVVPSKIDLPPPQTGRPKLAPNWPKDPDIAERAAARERAKQKRKTPEEERMPLLPSELAQRTPKSKGSQESLNPGNNNSNSPLMMMPSQLGYVGGLFSNPFGSTKTETEKFISEPERTELTQPPSGYQTPSAGYAYGVGQLKPPKEKCDAASGRCEKIWD